MTFISAHPSGSKAMNMAVWGTDKFLHSPFNISSIHLVLQFIHSSIIHLMLETFLLILAGFWNVSRMHEPQYSLDALFIAATQQEELGYELFGTFWLPLGA